MIMINQMQGAFRVLIIFSIITGLLYPLLITFIAQVFFPKQANGSLIIYQDKIIGSELIAQSFTQNKYFWPRPSATEPIPYNSQYAAGSNLGPSNPLLKQKISSRIQNMAQKNAHGNAIPIDLVTTSASGLDPHITLDAALYQAARVAKARNLNIAIIEDLINQFSKNHSWDLFAANKVNVLQLNLALEKLTTQRKS